MTTRTQANGEETASTMTTIELKVTTELEPTTAVVAVRMTAAARATAAAARATTTDERFVHRFVRRVCERPFVPSISPLTSGLSPVAATTRLARPPTLLCA